METLDDVDATAHLAVMEPESILLPRQPLASTVTRYATALAAVASATLVGLLIAQRWGDDAVVLLYIPAVLAAAIYAGHRPALAAAAASALAYNYYWG